MGDVVDNNGKNIKSIKKILKSKFTIFAVISILITATFLVLYMNGTINKWISPKKPSPNGGEVVVNPVSSEAVSSIITGNYDAGQAILDTSLKNTTDIKEQAWIYIQKSSVALNLNKYTEAYDFAKKAEELDATVSSAQMMATSAEKKGDINDAIAKYKLAISRMTGTSGMDSLDRKELQDHVSELESKL